MSQDSVGLVQPWTTVRGSSTTTTSDAADWIDVEPYSDATFWIDVREVTGSVTITFETAPFEDEELFMAATPAATLGLTASGSPLVVSTITTPTMPPLARWLRWRLTSTGGTWDACFRVWAAFSRSAYFSPLQLPGCVLWLRGDLGITLGSGGVQTWADQSGQGTNVSQSTPGSQPPYFAYPSSASIGSAMSNQAALKGDGAARTLATSADFTSISTDATLVTVATGLSLPEATGGSRLLETNNASGYYLGSDPIAPRTGYKLIVDYNTSPFGTAVGGTIGTAAPAIVGATYASASTTGSLYVYGQGGATPSYPPSAIATSTFPTPGTQTWPLTVLGNGFGYWNGYMGEAIIYDRALATLELVALYRYLGGRYNIVVP